MTVTARRQRPAQLTARNSSEIVRLIEVEQQAYDQYCEFHTAKFNPLETRYFECRKRGSVTDELIADYRKAEDRHTDFIAAMIEAQVAVLAYPVTNMSQLRTKANWMKRLHDAGRLGCCEGDYDALADSMYAIAKM